MQVQAAGAKQQMGQDQIQLAVSQLEQSGGRAVQACRNADKVDSKTQQAVQRAHDEISSLKKQIQMG